MTVEQLCIAVGGTLRKGFQTLKNSNNTVITNVSTDTRTIQKSDLFIALKGPNFDAHQLLGAAIDKGAAVVLVEAGSDISLPTESIVVDVKNTRIALGLLGSFVKQQIAGLKCAAITGSNGKTTCKELLSAILTVHSDHSDSVLSTSGNFNNDIGLPLTLLRLQKQHEFAVVELGANHIGEIAYTAALAKPNVALVNNIMPAHLEGFGSLEGVAKAKSEIWDSLDETGIAVVNLDADFASLFITKLANKKQPFITFSKVKDTIKNAPQVNVFATNIVNNSLGQACFTLNIKAKTTDFSAIEQSIEVQLNLPGEHNVSNALAASSMAYALGCSLIEIQQGLQTLQQVAGRVNCTAISEKLVVIDDTYNANSASVMAGIDLLTQYQEATRMLICGDMGELGSYAEQEHKAIGLYAKEKQIEKLFTVGSLSQLATRAYNAASQNNEAVHFSNKIQLEAALAAFLCSQENKTVILVKGSRSAKMEEIVAFIKQKYSL